MLFPLFFKTNIAIKKELFFPEQDDVEPQEYHAFLEPSTIGIILNKKSIGNWMKKGIRLQQMSLRCHDTHHYDTQHKDIKHNKTQYNDT